MQIMKKVRPQSGTHLKSMIRYTLVSNGVDESSDNNDDSNEEISYSYTEKTKDTHRGLGQMTVFRHPNVIERSFDHAFERLRPQLIALLERGLDRYSSFKFQLETSIFFRESDAVLESADEIIAYDIVQHLWVGAIQVHSLTNLDTVLEDILINLTEQIESYCSITSGWAIFDVLAFKCFILQSNPLKRADGFRKLPASVNPRFIVTPVNHLDNQCVFWSCAIHLSMHERFPLTSKRDWMSLIEGHGVPNQDQLHLQFGEK